MNWEEKVREYFEKERQALLRSLVDAKRARNEAPKPTESHSDTTMSEKEKIVTALELDLRKLEENLKKLAKAKLSYVELENGMKLVLVPEGMGGGVIDGVRLVSENAPLAQKIKAGEIRVLTTDVHDVH
jgi:hypothetical protein